MAYFPKVECANEIKYSIDYVKYIVCERKQNDALKYNKALQNASIEALVTTKSTEDTSRETSDDINNNPAAAINYSSIYIRVFKAILYRQILYFQV